MVHHIGYILPGRSFALLKIRAPLSASHFFIGIQPSQNMLALVMLILALDTLLPGLKGDQFYGHGETENEGGAVGKTFHTIILGTASLCL